MPTISLHLSKAGQDRELSPGLPLFLLLSLSLSPACTNTHSGELQVRPGECEYLCGCILDSQCQEIFSSFFSAERDGSVLAVSSEEADRIRTLCPRFLYNN